MAKVEQVEKPPVKVIKGGVAVDDRGSVRFVNDFNFEGVKRFYQIANHAKGFVRAWHYHEKEGKYVYVAKGSALVGVVNPDNPGVSQLVWKGVLSAQTPSVLWIPPGHANGFMNLEDDTIIQFFSTSTLEDSLKDDVRFDATLWMSWEVERR